MRIDLLAAGSCQALEALACGGAPWRRGRFDAGFAAIHRDDSDVVLFDTGYAARVERALVGFPRSLYLRLLPVTVREEDGAAAQLERRGVPASAVGTVVVSHFHPDHIGGLRDFPGARFVCSRRAWDAVRRLRGLAALRHGFLPALLPDDFEDRMVFAETLPVSTAGDGLGGWMLAPGLRLVPLDGHAEGQVGLWVEPAGVFLVADAVWRRATVMEGRLPHPLAMVIQQDRQAYRHTVNRLATLAQAQPNLRLLPSHDMGIE